MFKIAAARRASEASSIVQQPRDPARIWSRLRDSAICTPTTSCPASTARAAATAESTPPLKAAKTFTLFLQPDPPREPVPPPRGAPLEPCPHQHRSTCVPAKIAVRLEPRCRPIPWPKARVRAAELPLDMRNQKKPERPESQVDTAVNPPHSPEMSGANSLAAG